MDDSLCGVAAVGADRPLAPEVHALSTVGTTVRQIRRRRCADGLLVDTRATLPKTHHGVKDTNACFHAISEWTGTVNLVAACHVFAHIAERGTFTEGAAAAGTSQSVASRRIATLESALGAPLFDRSARNAALTQFGRDMLPSAKRLVQLADTMQHSAQQFLARPLTLAVPDNCSVAQLAALDAASRDLEMSLDFRTAAPSARVDLLDDRDVRAALITASPPGADWIITLGIGYDPGGMHGADASSGHARRPARPFRIESLRPTRLRPMRRRLWLQPEDDVAHVRDLVRQIGSRVGLLPAQIAVAPSVTAALADVTRSADVLLCSETEARLWGLSWQPVVGHRIVRGIRAEAVSRTDAAVLRDPLGTAVAACLGAQRRPLRSSSQVGA